MVLISVRGTQEFLADASRDADARQAPYEEGEGQAHRGFYVGFQAAMPFVERYLNMFYTGEQTLIICGHSLGGAIALLLAEWLQRKPTKPKVILYTFVKAARPLTHHRIVNHNAPYLRFHFNGWMQNGSGRFPGQLCIAHRLSALRCFSRFGEYVGDIFIKE